MGLGTLPYNVHPDEANMEDLHELLDDMTEEQLNELHGALAHRLPGENFSLTLLRVCHDLGHITTALYEYLTEPIC